MKHTEGKWRVGKSGNPSFRLAVIAEDGGSICHLTQWAEDDENAKLIAAAPEMLEALKSSLQMLEQDLVYRESNGLTMGLVFLKTTIDQVKKAIEKASKD